MKKSAEIGREKLSKVAEEFSAITKFAIARGEYVAARAAAEIVEELLTALVERRVVTYNSGIFAGGNADLDSLIGAWYDGEKFPYSPSRVLDEV